MKKLMSIIEKRTLMIAQEETQHKQIDKKTGENARIPYTGR